MIVKPIPVVLSGFGYYAQNYTVVPLMKKYPGIIQVIAITSLREGEFEEYVIPQFQNNNWKIPKLLDDIEDIFSLRNLYEEPKAVLISTPNSFHFNQARTAIEAGFHVYVERPIVTASDDLPALVDIASKRQVSLFTGPQRRLEAPFQYLYQSVLKNHNFGKLKGIRCRLAIREHLKDWRRAAHLAGGGVITDSGYHLLDIAAWLISSMGIEFSQMLSGAVCLGFNEQPFEGQLALDVETEAVGFVKLPNNIILSFDFTYNAPENSVYEQIELTDEYFGRIALTRAQAVRTSLPATISHQLSNGNFVEVETPLGQRVSTDSIRFSDESQAMKPLLIFLESLKKKSINTQVSSIVQARTSIPTWSLIREIYRIAKASNK